MKRDMVGTYGEYFVVTRLLSWGYPAAIVPGPFPYDVVADIDGTPVKIQVKSTNVAYKKSFRFECRHTKTKGSYRKGDYDIMAFVAVPNYRIHFDLFKDRKAFQKAVKRFNKQEERQSWDHCLAELQR